MLRIGFGGRLYDTNNKEPQNLILAIKAHCMAYRVVQGLGFRGLIGFVALLGLVGKIAFGVYTYIIF